MHHYLTKYSEDGKKYAEAWFQINFFRRSFCFWRKRVEI